MADVTISALPPGVPAGGNIVPYSTGSSTLGVAVSAMFHNAGKIGIGTSNPELTLDLTNTSDTGERAIRILNGSLRDLLIGVEGSSANRFLGSSINNAFVGSSSSAGLELATNNSVRMYINSDGNVGIGTTSPSTKLEVDGTIKASALQVPGALLQVVGTSDNTYRTTSLTIPRDNTIPQITEGAPFLSLNITPKSSSSKLLFFLEAYFQEASNTGDHAAFPLFRDSNANAIHVWHGELTSNNLQNMNRFSGHFLYQNNTTDATTYSVRWGNNVGTVYTLGNTLYYPTGLYGGLVANKLTVQEIAE